MATSKRENDAEAGTAPKATRRRTTSATSSATPSPEPSAATASTRTGPTHDASRGVTEAKPPASAMVPAPEYGATLPVSETPRNAEDEIRRRAYELYEQDGRNHGRDREHWLRAEAEIIGRASDGRSSEDQARDARAEHTRRTQKSA